MYKICPLCRRIYYKKKFESINRFLNEHKWCSRRCWYNYAKENKIGFFGNGGLEERDDLIERFYLIDEKYSEMSEDELCGEEEL